MLKRIFIVLGVSVSGICFAGTDEEPLEEYNERTSYLIKRIDEQVREGDPDTIALLQLMAQERKRTKELTGE